MENGCDRSIRVEFFLKDCIQKTKVKDVSLIKSDSFFIRSYILLFGKVMRY